MTALVKISRIRKIMNDPFPDVELTNGEREVVSLIAEGQRPRDIARMLDVSHQAIYVRLRGAERKIGMKAADIVPHVLSQIRKIVSG